MRGRTNAPGATSPGINQAPARRLAATLGLSALVIVGCAQVPPVQSGGGDQPTYAATGTPAHPTGTPGSPHATPDSSASHPPQASTCTDAAAALPLRERAGQLVMLGVTGELDAAESKAITTSAAGSVILMGNTTGGVAATKVRTDALAKLAGPAC
ncbi:MAG: hypothetical protein QM708_10310 [Propioniciclava sp.]|uniref:hypothetical protein n=1 Tax=Propioniciclava sp. TaxID=2038686 RepID=UPI0039E260FA